MEKAIINCICRNYTSTEYVKRDLLKCFICKKYSHKNCMINMSAEKENKFICPFCQLSLVNPLSEEIDVIMEPNFLKPFKKSNSNEKKRDNFLRLLNALNLKMKEDEFEDEFEFNIRDDYYMNQNENNDKLYYFSIYCLKLDEEGFKIEWPDNTSLIINESKYKNNIIKINIQENAKNLPVSFKNLAYNCEDVEEDNEDCEINLKENNFMFKNTEGKIISNFFLIGLNTIKIKYHVNTKDYKNINKLYFIAIKREKFILWKYYITRMKYIGIESDIIFKKENKIKNDFIENGEIFLEAFHNFKLYGKGLFCKDHELIDISKLIEEFSYTGKRLICQKCNKVIGIFNFALSN